MTVFAGFPKKNLPNHFSGHLVWKILWGFAPASAALRHQMSSSTQMSSPAKFHQTPFWSAGDLLAHSKLSRCRFLLHQMGWVGRHESNLYMRRGSHHKLWGFFMALKFAFGGGFSILLYGLPQYYLYFIISIGYCYEFSSFCNVFLCLFMNNEIGHRTDSILHLN